METKSASEPESYPSSPKLNINIQTNSNPKDTPNPHPLPSLIVSLPSSSSSSFLMPPLSSLPSSPLPLPSPPPLNSPFSLSLPHFCAKYPNIFPSSNHTSSSTSAPSSLLSSPFPPHDHGSENDNEENIHTERRGLLHSSISLSSHNGIEMSTTDMNNNSSSPFLSSLSSELSRLLLHYQHHYQSLLTSFNEMSSSSSSPSHYKSKIIIESDITTRHRLIDLYVKVLECQHFCLYNYQILCYLISHYIHHEGSKENNNHNKETLLWNKIVNSDLNINCNPNHTNVHVPSSSSLTASIPISSSSSSSSSPLPSPSSDINRHPLVHLQHSIENLYSDWYCHNDTSLAKSQLLMEIAKSHSSLSSSSSPSSSSTSSSPSSLSSPHSLNWSTFDIGMRFGCFLLLLTWFLWDVIVDSRLRPSSAPQWVQSTFPVYRGIGILLFLGWLYGGNLFIFQKYKLNYMAIFELDPTTTMNHSAVFYRCINYSIVYLINFLVYFKMLRGDFPSWFPSGLLPISLFCFFAYKLYPKGRSSIYSGFAQLFISPFGRVSFLASYLGDVITSLVRPLIDWSYSLCFLFSLQWIHETKVGEVDPSVSDHCLHSPFFKKIIMPLLSALPLWLRLMQCLRRYIDTKKRWPNLGNAFKYAASHSIVLFGVFHSMSDINNHSGYKSIFYLLFIMSTMYTFYWDIVMDWNIIVIQWGKGSAAASSSSSSSTSPPSSSSSSSSFFCLSLRDPLLYHHRFIYYFCIVLDFFLRFAWTLTLLPHSLVNTHHTPADPSLSKAESFVLSTDFILYLQPTLAAAEVFRRCMWGCLRVENEHIMTSAVVVQNYQGGENNNNLGNGSGNDKTGRTQLIEVIAITLTVASMGFFAAMTAPPS